MSVQLEARFLSDSGANLAVERLRQSGILFELLELKPARSRWRGEGETKNRATNSILPNLPEGYISINPTGAPFESLFARAHLASNAMQMGQDSGTEIQLRINVTEKSLGTAEKIIRGARGYGLKTHR